MDSSVSNSIAVAFVLPLEKARLRNHDPGVEQYHVLLYVAWYTQS